MTLHAWKAACEGATGGEWFADDRGWITSTIDPNRPGEEVDIMSLGEARNIDDLRFAVVARTALPAAIQRIEELEREVERLRGLLAEVWDIADSRACNVVRASTECHCDRLRRIGEMESAAAKGAP